MLHRKAVLSRLCVEDRNGFSAKVRIVVDMDDFQALELFHAAHPLANEADLGRVLTPVAGRRVEYVWKHPPIRGVGAPIAHRDQGDLVVRGPLKEGIGGRRAHGMKHRRPRGPLGFQALITLYSAGGVVDGFALLPDQFDAVDAAVALIEQSQIGDVAIGTRYLTRPRGPLACAEHGEKLFTRHRHRCHPHQPTEHSGYELAPPRVRQSHNLLPQTVGTRLAPPRQYSLRWQACTVHLGRVGTQAGRYRSQGSLAPWGRGLG